MALTGTYEFQQTWFNANGKQLPPEPTFQATFNADGTVTLTPSGGFRMVWFTGSQTGQPAVILAGDGFLGTILAVYYGAVNSDGSLSGTANGTMPIEGPITAKWQATPVSS